MCSIRSSALAFSALVATAGVSQAQCTNFVDFSSVTGNGFFAGVGAAGTTADVTVSGGLVFAVLGNSVLKPLFGNLGNPPSFNNNAGPNALSGPSGTAGNNTYVDSVTALNIASSGPDPDSAFTVTLEGFSQAPRILFLMNVGNDTDGYQATINVKDENGNDLDWTLWPRYQDTGYGISILEAGPLLDPDDPITCQGDPGEQSNGIFLIAPPSPEVKQVTFSGVKGTGGGTDYQIVGVALYCPTVAVYCTSGISAGGCSATMAATGNPSASTSSGFNLIASGVEGQKDGLFFFGTNGRQANSWGSGTSFQCVVPPVMRAGLLTGSGTQGACDGGFTQDLNALWCASCSSPLKNPGPGALVQAQLWYRDPLSSSNQTTSLSDAGEFPVVP